MPHEIDDAEWRDKQMLYEQQQQSKALKTIATNVDCLVFVIVAAAGIFLACAVLWGIGLF